MIDVFFVVLLVTTGAIVCWHLIGSDLWDYFAKPWLEARREEKELTSKPKDLAFGVPRTEYNQLSWPAKQIIGLYDSIPVEHRPAVDILSAVKALDEKYEGARAVDGAFTDYYTGVPRWEPAEPRDFRRLSINVSRDRSVRKEYAAITDSLQSIKDAYEDQQYTLKMAGMQVHFDEITKLHALARQEREIITSVTQGIKEL